MFPIVCKGIVKGRTVILEEDAVLPEGTEVLVTPLTTLPGSPQALMTAMRAEPHLKPEDVDEFERLIEEGKGSVSYASPFQKKRIRRRQ
ncbi:MAG: hypothetical protein ACREOH_11425 [Candidatus Entotheonellia bacterium]